MAVQRRQFNSLLVAGGGLAAAACVSAPQEAADCAAVPSANGLQSEFLALQDLPDFTAGPMKKGGRIFINTFVFYDLRGGKFARIRSAEFRKIDRQASG